MRLPLLVPIHLGLWFAATAQEAEFRSVNDAYRPCLVELRYDDNRVSQEGFQGFLVNDQGLVLASWRKVCLPGQFQGSLGMGRSGSGKGVVVGVHPSRDLALLKLSISGGNGLPQWKPRPISFASSSPGPNEPLYLIQKSNSNLIPVRPASESEPGDHQEYFFVAPENKNALGYFGLQPDDVVVNLKGQLVGIGTRTVVNGKLAVRFVPVHDLDLQSFLRPSERKADPFKVRELLQCVEAADRISKSGRFDPRYPDNGASEFLRLALAEDPTNADVLFRLGLAGGRSFVGSSPSAILARSILSDPWSESNVDAYLEMGKALLNGSNQTKKAEAVAVMAEGAAKFPTKSAKLWEALAKGYWDLGNFLQCARSCRMAGEISGGMSKETREYYDKSRLRLAGSSEGDLNQFESNLGEQIGKMRAEAAAARKESRDFITAEGARVIKQESGNAPSSASSGEKTAHPDPTASKSDAQVDKEFARSRLNMAIEHLKSGRISLAKGILEDIVQSYPKLEDAKSAQQLLDALNPKK